MSEEEFSPIRPKSVPLSHVEPASAPKKTAPTQKRWPLLVAVLLLGLLLGVVFLVIPGLVGQPEVTVTEPRPAPIQNEAPASIDRDDTPPPFEALMREQTREKAQAELSRFVELQMALEKRMQVGLWGQDALDSAMALATKGDEQFVEEAFEASLDSYRAAGDALAELITTGEGLLAAALEAGQKALDLRDPEMALAQFQHALTIDPENSTAATGIARAALLPQIIELMRAAKNHELAGDYRSALTTYEQIRAIDSKTEGLATALANARSGVAEMRFREYLSEGFRAMDSERFEQARSAFNKALALKPDDPVAVGGLEQVAERKDLATIRQFRASAEKFEASEEWRDATENYKQVLALDNNIQFAKAGLARSSVQERTQITLGNIIASPDKLSSKTLYGQAQDILKAATTLVPRGPRLTSQIGRVADLLDTYGTPVAVTFRSDNRTEVTLSTVGRLGTFSEKQLSLRPGAYTVIGSRDGCRDIRESILVRPDMQPVEISCEETF
ncbi:MAG: tetratricopeptide repeat protein [Pseudomonadales bacterium]